MTYERRNPFAPFARKTGEPPPEPKRAEPSASTPRTVTAEMILRAGRRARGEEADDTMPPAGSLAEKIILAAQKAKGRS
jgi:hypothetical protein